MRCQMVWDNRGPALIACDMMSASRDAIVLIERTS